MNKLLEFFWEWLPIPYEEYAIKGTSSIGVNYEENFPYINELLGYAEMIVKEDITTDDCVRDLLDIMAIENESESILELIEEKSTEHQLNRIISIGMTHPLYEARWQLVELIYRRKPHGYENYLYKMLEDSHPYVKKRASNCISYDQII